MKLNKKMYGNRMIKDGKMMIHFKENMMNVN